MKQTSFIVIVVASNIMFIFLQIYKNGLLIQTSFDHQKLITHQSALKREKETLTHQLYLLKNPQAIKEFAATTLGMAPIKLTQIHRVEDATKI